MFLFVNIIHKRLTFKIIKLKNTGSFVWLKSQLKEVRGNNNMGYRDNQN